MRGCLHDLNNQLSAISGFAEMGFNAAGEGDPEKIRRYFGHILGATRTASRIIHETSLRLAGGWDHAAEVSCEVNPAIALRIFALSDLPHLRVSSDMSQDLPRARIGALDLERVLLNLAQNACDAIHGAGSIRFESRHIAREVLISVRDSGCGMSAELRDRLVKCESVSTKDDNGRQHGVGLSRVVWPRVLRCGGRIEIESAPGRGSTFTIALPAV